jgi:SHS family lactate transporter-like MFS transporter
MSSPAVHADRICLNRASPAEPKNPAGPPGGGHGRDLRSGLPAYRCTWLQLSFLRNLKDFSKDVRVGTSNDEASKAACLREFDELSDRIAFMSNSRQKKEQANQINAVLAGFLGWTLDAFDFFVLIFVVSEVAREFGRSIPAIALTITASLAMRPLGALIFGILADRYGRRTLLMANIVFYTVMEIFSGLAPTFAIFFFCRMLYGVGMGGTWGVGATLALESIPGKRRGLVSGLLQEGYATGNLLAAITYYTVFPHWGWRPMFFIGAIPTFLVLFICLQVKESEAWHQSRTDWTTYKTAVTNNWRLFLYLVILMAMMNFMSHGTQDMYPTFLRRQRHFSVNTTALITIISMLGAICGGIAFGLLSDRKGRRRAMVTATLLAAFTIPLWVFAPNLQLIATGAFIMQFMVQGTWGVIPAHIMELSPSPVRAFFPGFAYQLGVLIASSIGYIEAVMGEHFRYGTSMGILALAILVIGAVVISFGPEAKGISFFGGEKERANNARENSLVFEGARDKSNGSD